MIFVIKTNKIRPLQDQEIIKANQVEEDQPVVSKVENLLDQHQNAKRTYLSSEEQKEMRRNDDDDDDDILERRWQ